MHRCSYLPTLHSPVPRTQVHQKPHSHYTCGCYSGGYHITCSQTSQPHGSLHYYLSDDARNLPPVHPQHDVHSCLHVQATSSNVLKLPTTCQLPNTARLHSAWPSSHHGFMHTSSPPKTSQSKDDVAVPHYTPQLAATSHPTPFHPSTNRLIPCAVKGLTIANLNRLGTTQMHVPQKKLDWMGLQAFRSLNLSTSA